MLTVVVIVLPRQYSDRASGDEDFHCCCCCCCSDDDDGGGGDGADADGGDEEMDDDDDVDCPGLGRNSFLTSCSRCWYYRREPVVKRRRTTRPLLFGRRHLLPPSPAKKQCRKSHAISAIHQNQSELACSPILSLFVPTTEIQRATIVQRVSQRNIFIRSSGGKEKKKKKKN